MSFLLKRIFGWDLADPDPKKILIRGLLFSGFFHLLAVIFSEGFHRPDEHLGMMRMVGLKLGWLGPSDLSWELPAMIRSWAQPAFYWLVAKVFFLDDPFLMASIFRFLSSVLGLFSVACLAGLSQRLCEDRYKSALTTLFLFCLWYLPFFQARTSTENFSSSFIYLGMFLLLGLDRPFWAGLLLTFAFYFRIQTAPLSGGLILWAYTIGDREKKEIFPLLGGVLLAVGINLLIDRWGHGVWTITPWNNLYQNLVVGKASSYGTDPFYKYITKTFSRGVFPFSVAFIVPMFWLWIKRPKHVVTWMSAPFFLAHCLIAHKELRFIFVLGPFCAFAAAEFYHEYRDRFVKGWAVLREILAIELIVLSLICSLRPAHSTMGMYKFLATMDPQPKVVHTMNVVRDVLKFYLVNKEMKFIHQPNIMNMEAAMGQIKKGEKGHFVMDKIFHMTYFKDFPQCKRRWLSVPQLALKYEKWLKRSKVWALYECDYQPPPPIPTF